VRKQAHTLRLQYGWKQSNVRLSNRLSKQLTHHPSHQLSYPSPLPAAICRAMTVVSSYAVCEAATEVISAWS